MAYANKCIFIGRLTADPEPPRSLNNGGRVAKFSIAVGRSRKNAAGQWENDPNPLYIDCEVFTNEGQKFDLVRVVDSYLKKGGQVYVEGRLQLDRWDDKQTGAKRSKHKLVVSDIQMLDRAGSEGEGGGQATAPAGDDQGGGDWDGAPF